VSTLDDLVSSAREAHRRELLGSLNIVLVDNSPPEPIAPPYSRMINQWSRAQPPWIAAAVISGHGNVGFGAGHNLAGLASDSVYHLVLNPDVNLAPEALTCALEFLRRHPEIGLIAPAATNPLGRKEYLCKRYPCVATLLLRAFAPNRIKRYFSSRLDWYEMRDVINDRDPFLSPPLISGCFMLFRTPVFRSAGGFAPDFFLYFEDFDLSLRIARSTRIAYVPQVRVVHHGGYAARKGPRHVVMFLASAVRFFNRHGWRWF